MSIVRILCIGDPHFTEASTMEMDKFSQKSLNLIDKLLLERKESIDKESGLDLVVVLGDILDRFEKAHSTVHTQSVKWLYQISTKCQLLILIGNHDRINNNVFLSEESFFWSCRHWNNTIVADDGPKEIFIKGFKFIGVPYVYPGRFTEALDRIKDWQSADAIFAHQEIKGCSLGIIKSEGGDPWTQEMPLLISGHIHEYEQLSENMIYVGTPRMKTFGDQERKTVSLFTLKKNEGKGEWRCKMEQERISLELPKKMSIKLTVNQITSANELLNLDEDLTGVLKICVQGTSSELAVGLKNPIVKHLRSLGAKIIGEEIQNESLSSEKCDSKNKGDSGSIELISRTELQKKIWERLSLQPELLQVMKNLFGTVKLKIV